MPSAFNSSAGWKALQLQQQHHVSSSRRSHSARTCIIRAFQKIWRPGTNRLLSPTSPLLQTSLVVLPSQSRIHDETEKQQNDSTSRSLSDTSKIDEELKRAVLRVSDLCAIDFANLFTIAASPVNRFSTPYSCHTFVLSDWDCFEEAAGRGKPEPDIPLIFNIVRRSKNDFAYNNHIYDALRNSFDLALAQEKDITTAKENDDNENDDVKMNRNINNNIDQTEVEKLRANDDKSHTSCSTMMNQLAKLNKSQAYVDECSSVNLNTSRTSQSSSSSSSSSSSFIYFFPFKNSVNNICYENKNFFVIVNLKPVEKAGHLLVIPKKVVSTLGECLFPDHDFNAEDNCNLSQNTNAKKNNNNTRASCEGEEIKEYEIALDLGDAIAKSIEALNKRWRCTSSSSSSSPDAQEKRDLHKNQCDGFSIVVQHGECAGQTVAHLHIHVIALAKGEGICKASSSSVLDPDADKRSAEELEEEERMLRRPRTAEEMAKEAEDLRKNYFSC